MPFLCLLSTTLNSVMTILSSFKKVQHKCMHTETIWYLILLIFELYRRVLYYIYITFQHCSFSFNIKIRRSIHLLWYGCNSFISAAAYFIVWLFLILCIHRPIAGHLVISSLLFWLTVPLFILKNNMLKHVSCYTFLMITFIY